MKKKAFSLILLLCALSMIATGSVAAMEEEEEINSLVSFGAGWISRGRTLSFTAEADTLFDVMMIPIVVFGDDERGVLTATISKRDTTGEVISLVQNGTASPKLSYVTGITPRTISLKPIVYWTQTIILYSALLYSAEEGPYSYTVNVSFGTF
jgi:hypothetical protein